MARAIILCIFVSIIASFSLVRSENDNSKKQFEDFRNQVLSELSTQRSALTNLEKTFNRSLALMEIKVDSLSNAISPNSKISANGIIVAQDDGVVSIALPSLQQSRISNDRAAQVAFEPWGRKVYWLSIDNDIKRANLDGTHVEIVATGEVGSFALDTITANFYYRNYSSDEIRVCRRSGEKCSILATNQLAYGFALHPSKSLMVWPANYTSVVRANMDGSGATVILAERIRRLYVDEDSDRVYWNQHRQEGGLIASSDLNGQDVRVLVNSSEIIRGLAVDTDRVYFGDFYGKRVLSVSKDGGSSVVVAGTTGRISGIALYGGGGKAQTLENPCKRSPCSHLCVLKLESFACLCPEGKQLAEDGRTCV